ncbi:hypothetical protein AC1031_003309 [Aphanomyces cochlioides]|nr:hypothetical protein AC1031_003309 [Aphanomyces cochlioides]
MSPSLVWFLLVDSLRCGSHENVPDTGARMDCSLADCIKQRSLNSAFPSTNIPHVANMASAPPFPFSPVRYESSTVLGVVDRLKEIRIQEQNLWPSGFLSRKSSLCCTVLMRFQALRS